MFDAITFRRLKRTLELIKQLIVITLGLSVIYILFNLYSKLPGNQSCPIPVSVRPEIVNNALRRNLSLSHSTGEGSGVNLGNGNILTALHVVREPLYEQARGRTNGALTIDDREQPIAVVKESDSQADIVLLKAPKLNSALPPLACYKEKLKLTQTILMVGNPAGHRNIVTAGSIVGIDTPYGPGSFIADALAMGGNSGGGVYDANTGQLIGIAQRSDGRRVYGRRCTNYTSTR